MMNFFLQNGMTMPLRCTFDCDFPAHLATKQHADSRPLAETFETEGGLIKRRHETRWFQIRTCVSIVIIFSIVCLAVGRFLD